MLSAIHFFFAFLFDKKSNHALKDKELFCKKNLELAIEYF
jgi:hypothetical protein